MASSPSFPRTRRSRPAPSLANTFARVFAVIMLGLGVTTTAFWALTSTLDEMTLRDCQAGVVKACEELQK